MVVSCRRGSHAQSSCPRGCGHCHGPAAFRASGQREGAGLGRALAYLERAAERPEGSSLGGWLRRALLDGLLPTRLTSTPPEITGSPFLSHASPPCALWLASC